MMTLQIEARDVELGQRVKLAEFGPTWLVIGVGRYWLNLGSLDETKTKIIERNERKVYLMVEDGVCTT